MDLSKLSDKVLAKFARRATTMKMVLVAVDAECAAAVDAAVQAVKDELAKRNVQWQGTE